MNAVTVRKSVRETVCSSVNPGRKAVEVTRAPGRSDVVVTVMVWTAWLSIPEVASTASRTGGTAGTVWTRLRVRVTKEVLAGRVNVLAESVIKDV